MSLAQMLTTSAAAHIDFEETKTFKIWFIIADEQINLLK